MSIAAISLSGFLSSAFGKEKIIRIIHTNDLHSAFFPLADGTGGYARLKTKIDQLKSEKKIGMYDIDASIYLDAGDFMEGSAWSFADQYRYSVEALSMLGPDLVAIGNHDFQMGTKNLNRLIDRYRKAGILNFPLLSANLKWPGRSSEKNWTPSAVLERAGVKIGVVGVTTREAVYKWASKLKNGVLNPYKKMEAETKALRGKVDVLIGLSHLGLEKDIKLAKKDKRLDLIIGGHSHSEVIIPRIAQHDNGKTTPVFQAGSYARHVGSILLSVDDDKKITLLRYDWHIVDAQTPENPQMKALVEKADDVLENQYGGDPEWRALDESIGNSPEILEVSENRPTPILNFAADAWRRSTGAEVGFEYSVFLGESLPAGPLTRKSLMRLIPRQFDLDQTQGWNVHTADVSGWLIRALLGYAVRYRASMGFAGIDCNIYKNRKGKWRVRNVRIGGRPLNLLRSYRVAMNEGIVRGAYEMSPILGSFLANAEVERVSQWNALETWIAEEESQPGGLGTTLAKWHETYGRWAETRRKRDAEDKSDPLTQWWRSRAKQDPNDAGYWLNLRLWPNSTTPIHQRPVELDPGTTQP